MKRSRENDISADRKTHQCVVHAATSRFRRTDRRWLAPFLSMFPLWCAGIPNNLMPYIQRVASGRLPQLTVYGTDYDTPDGACTLQVACFIDGCNYIYAG